MSLREWGGAAGRHRLVRYHAILAQRWQHSQRVIGNVLPYRREMAASHREKVLIINGHPDARTERYCAALCDAYARGAAAGGADARLLKMGDLPEASAAGPDASLPPAPSDEWLHALEMARWADRYVIIFPLWLNEPPKPLQSFFESVVTSGITGEDRFSAGRRAQKKTRVVVTMDMPGFALRALFRSGGGADPVRDCLSFAGIAKPDMTFVGCVSTIPAEQRASWLRTLEQLGADGK